jgi:endogenous inhibitor of DNA gyrase (YacG/DUF329 family)
MKVKCPSCRRESTKDGNKFFPFCSARCQLVDLGKWLDEKYRIPGEPVDPDEIDPEGKHD